LLLLRKSITWAEPPFGKLQMEFFMIMYKGVTTNCSAKWHEAHNTQ
jgi:hypothetical protein